MVLGKMEAGPADRSSPLIWSVRPCDRRRPLAALVVALILCLSLAVQVYFGGALWGALTLVLLGLSVLPFYVRTRYELNDEEVVARGLFATYRRPWIEIKGLFPDADGVLVSPLSRPSRLAYTRGIFLRFGDNRDEVLSCVEAHVARASGGDEDPSSGSGVG